MPARLRLVALILVACLLGAGVGLWLARRPTASPAAPAGGFAGFLRPAGLSAGDFTLRDEQGRSVHLASLRGTPVIVTFVYSTCQNTCPIMVQQIRQALDLLARPVPALAVSVDPAHDTRQTARRFLLKQGVTGRVRFLLGTQAQLAPVWHQFAIAPQRDGLEHSAYVVLVDRRGLQRVGFPQGDLTPENLAHDVRRLQSERT